MVFKQFDYKFNRKTFELLPKGIKIVSEGIGTRTENIYDFEDIGTKIFKHKKSNTFCVYAAGIGFLFSLFLIFEKNNGENIKDSYIAFDLFVSSVFMILFMLSKRDSVFLSRNDNSNKIEFFANTPKRSDCQNFIDKILLKRKEFLLEKYGNVDEAEPKDKQLSNFNWLLDIDIINKDEYEQKVSLLNAKFDSKRKRIGFCSWDQ